MFWTEDSRENKSTLLMFSNRIPKIVPGMRGETWCSQTDHMWQYTTARALCCV